MPPNIQQNSSGDDVGERVRPSVSDQSSAGVSESMELALREVVEGSDFSVQLNQQLIDVLSSGYMHYIRRILLELRGEWVKIYGSTEQMLLQRKEESLESMEAKMVEEMAGALLVEYVSNQEVVTIPFPDVVRQRLHRRFLQVPGVDFEDESPQLDPILKDFLDSVFKNIALKIEKDRSRQKGVSFEKHVADFYGYNDPDECFTKISDQMYVGIGDTINFQKRQIDFSLPLVRHTCLGIMHALHSNQKLQQMLHGPKKAHAVTGKADAIRYLSEMDDRERLADLPPQPARKKHRALSPQEVTFNKGITVRIAGSDIYGSLLPNLDDDIHLFQQTEEILTKWLAPFYRYFDKKELSPQEEAEIDDAIQEFHTKGGHAGKLREDQIRYLMTHGVVLFLEKYINEQIKIVVGTVSALTRTPCRPIEGEIEDPEKWEQQAHEYFPNYDMGSLSNAHFGAEHNRIMRASAGDRIFIVRSSILNTLSKNDLAPQLQGESLPEDWEGKSMRRLGLAARGKIEILNMGIFMKRKSVGMNIGVINKPGSMNMSMGNLSSTEHNAWVPGYTWRTGHTPLLKEGYLMNWVAHMAEDIGAGEKDLWANLTTKGWNRQTIENSALQNLAVLMEQIKMGKHADF